ncbi:tetratricopeptide repeat protein [Gramella sp. GC03-9]|uniref:Tetratricopeptide repeat protein n=1 Tax=Christiangramia oceanisediminis TaxID=2920386 RepID=A0A9X2I074_9FLAO|nr:tetratricopeptide repeat protein [Gramella oceanisediminis]MCP9198859.1 tetratricopeptide repeat protein [Gramella oceanisediminis]
MKNKLIFLGLLIPVISLSQEINSEIQKLSNKVVPEFCGCLEEYDMLEFEEKFGDCFGANLQKYENEMNQFFSNDTTQIAQQQNDRFVADLLMGMQAKLFKECPVYYNFIDKMKSDAISELRANDVGNKLDSLNNLNESQRDNRFQYMKASMLFADRNYQEAKNAINEGLKLNTDNERFKVLLAWIYEEEKEIDKAVKIYDELYTEKGRIELMLFREFTRSKLVERKEPEKNCSDFKTGKFKMGGTNGRRLVLIERTDNIQIETSVKDNSVTTMKIEWIDDCSYILKYTESTNPEMDEYIGKELNVSIIGTSEDNMRFKATMNGVEHVMIDEMQKVSD